jgi:ribosomal protein S4
VAGRVKQGGRKEEDRLRLRKERDARAPVGTLLFREVERRLDVLIFRACFAPSVWQARQMVVHRKVKVNGQVVSRGNQS